MGQSEHRPRLVTGAEADAKTGQGKPPFPLALLHTLMRPWWRLTRSLTLGVRGVVIDGDNRVLLVRHSYDTGWHLPGGGVERGETLHRALQRELHEEANVILDGPARLHGMFSNHATFPGDHVAVFVAGSWRQDGAKRPGMEIRAAQFFDIAALPDATTAGTRRRLAEIHGEADVTEFW
jgi:ADP-ribose pyrophosphatase YjhB (NUDIX family)